MISLPLTPDQRHTARAALANRQDLPDADLLELITAYLAEKAEPGPANVDAPISGRATIRRDGRGVPHIAADSASDLYFALGYAEAQDRLWQLDYLRRLGHGRLAEIFGAERLADDILSRTLDISGIAERCVAALAPESREALEAFSAGINAWIEQLPNGLPAEFEWLGYEPEPWRPVDSLAIQRRWWWYLTGRLHVLWTPEIVRESLDPDRFAAYYTPDAEVGYIVPGGSYHPTPRWPAIEQAAPAPMGGGEGGEGSNNWAVSPALSATGSALLASDPHVYYTVPAEWYEAGLSLAGNEVFGCSYPGVPAFLIGRNEHLAWGITNNICLQRDLFIEELDASGERYRDGDEWRELDQRIERIIINGSDPYEITIRSAHGRPVIDHLVPEAVHPRAIWPEKHARSAVSLAWVGFEASDEVQSAIELGRASTIAEGREAFRGWKLPTWNILLADTAGKIAYQCIGELPLRGREWIGYRDANDPVDRWQHPIPYDAMPALIEPERGWVGSANNPTAPPDFPYPLFGCWTPEDRFPRLSQLIEEQAPHSLDSFADMQADIYSGRGSRAITGIVTAIGTPADPTEAQALALLAEWNGELAIDSVAGSIYNVFFWKWHQCVVRERFPERWLTVANESGNGLSAALLHENAGGWFGSDEARNGAISTSFTEAIAWLREQLGENPDEWLWGRLHTLGAHHPAAKTPLQRLLFDVAPKPHQGGTSTLANAHFGLGGSYASRLGASYRFITDLAKTDSTLAICWPGQSGHPGSSHYADQHEPYLRDEYFSAFADASGKIELRAVR